MLKKVKKDRTPKLSIVIPSYNKFRYIDETLESIFSQNYENLEVIVQDGGSSDGTVNVIKKYATKFPSFLKWESKKDKGQADAINKGLSKARGDIFTFINADDVYEKEAFFHIADAYKRNSNAYWFAGRGKVINQGGVEIAKYITAYKNSLLSANYYQFLLIVNYLIQPSVFLTKRGLFVVGRFMSVDRIVMEYEAWLKLGKIDMPVVLNRNLSLFRMSGNNTSSVLFDTTLSSDQKVASKYTSNKLILFLHKVHNDLRRVVVQSL